MRRKILSLVMIFIISTIVLGGCNKKSESETQIIIFASKSLNSALDEIIEKYESTHPNVSIRTSYDSAGTLMTQIKEGAECDVFFSADTKQMDELHKAGLVVKNTRKNIVNNQVCLVTYKNSGTKVTGIKDIKNASSMALADGAVPVGKYARVTMIYEGLLEKTDEPATITASDISAALDGLEINECANVGVVITAVSEGSNEVGFVYYSDYKGYEDSLDIIEILPYEATGDVIYPAAVIVNMNASDEMKSLSSDFVEFLKSDEAKAVFEKYYFDVNIE